MKKLHYLFILVFIFSSAAMAQENEWESGEIEEAEVVIEKDRIIKLPQKGRTFEKVPDDENQGKPPSLSHTYKPIDFIIPDVRVITRPLTVKPEPLPSVYRGNVRAGYGNFGTPYAELSYGTGKSDEYHVNGIFRHLSSAKGPVDNENSANSQNLLVLDGNIFLNDVTIGGNLTYQRDNFYFYGYDQTQEVNRDSIQQTLNNFTLTGFLKNKSLKNESFYDLNLVFDLINDRFDAQEADFGFAFDSKFFLNDNYYLGVDADLSIINRKDRVFNSFNRNFFRIRPYVEFKNDALSAKVGFTGVAQNDTITNAKPFHFFPYLEARYKVSDNVEVYAGLTGDVEKQNLKTNLRQNQFLNQGTFIFHNIRAFDFFGGVSGKAGSVGYGAGVNVAYYRNLHFYINSPADTSKFDIIYDTGTTNVNNLFGKLSYQIDKKLILGFEGNYYIYQTDEVQEAWHRPEYKLLFLSNYTFNQKFTIAVDAYLIGGIKALEPTLGTSTSIDPVFDLIAKLEYHISDRASVFVHGYNLLNQEYQFLLNYPHRGFQVLGGLSYSF